MDIYADRKRPALLHKLGGLRRAGGFLMMAVIVGAALLLLELSHELARVSEPAVQNVIAAGLDQVHQEPIEGGSP